MSSLIQYEFLPAETHNPDCDITSITVMQQEQFCYGVYIKGDKAGQEFLEWYKGPNYVPGSSKRNWSKHYNKIPSHKTEVFNDLKEYYKKHFFNPRFESIFAI
jgi:hypothetical protein